MREEITPDSLLEAVARAGPQPRQPHSIPARYEVRGLLGEGGFGVVYDVFDRERGGHVALKTLHRVESDSLIRFKREFRTLVDLRHENLVRLFELGGEGQSLWFTMERLSAATPFDDWVRGDPERLRAALRQLVAGLSVLHARGILHRDLKSSNVLVEADGRVVLLDFGLAREATGGDSTQLAGTPLFMAPEQCAEGELTPAVDLYALGVMLFVELAGRHPFEGGALQVMLAKQLNAAPPVSSVTRDAPDDLATLVDALLATRPADRPTAREVHERLGAPMEPAVVAAQAPVEELFVGREAELARLHAIVRARRGVLVRLEGPSGIGKTALLDQLCVELGDAWVLRGRCHPRESVPYKAFDEVIDQLSHKLARHPDPAALLPRDTAALQALFPVLGTVCGGAVDGAGVDRARGLAALRELLARLADRHSVVIAIDDLQWGDADSARLLVEILHQPDAPALTVVATARLGDAGALADQLEALVDADVEVRDERLALGPLPSDDALALATHLTGSGERADAIARASEGHPLLLTELARHDEEDDIDGLLGRRIDATVGTDRAVLELVSVAGHLLDEPVLERATEEEVSEAIERLAAARLLRVSPAGVRVYHDRIGELLVAGLEAAERHALQRCLAESLAATGGDEEQIASHFDAAGDPRAAAYTARAARRAMDGLAYRNAATLYARALELRSASQLSREERYALTRGRALALKAAGQALDAAEAHLRAAALAPTSEARGLRAEAGLLLTLGGHVDRSFEVLSGLLNELGTRFPQSHAEATARIAAEKARGWLRARFGRRTNDPLRVARLDALWAIYHGMMFTRPLFGLAAATMYLSEAEAVASPKHRFLSVCIEAFLSTVRKGAPAREAALARVNAAYAEISGIEDEDVQLERAVTLANIRHFGLDVRGSVVAHREALELAAKTEHSWDIIGMTARGMISSSLFVLGDVPELRRLAPQLVIEANERDQLLMWVLAAYHHWWTRALQQGSDEASERSRQEIGDRWRARGNEMQDWWDKIALVSITLVADRPREAYDRISQDFVEALAARVFTDRFHYLEGRMLIARAAVAVATRDPRRRDELLLRAEEIRRELRAEPSAWTLALSVGLEAGIMSLRDDRAAVRRLLRALIPAADDAGLVLLAALAREELSILEGDDALGLEAAAFYDDAAMDTSLYAARVMLPGRFHVTGALGR